MLTGKQKSFLRSKANTLDPIVQIGKGGVTETVVNAVNQALVARELVKINVLNNCLHSMQEVTATLVRETESDLVQQVGKKVLLFRRNSNNPVIDLPE